MANEKLIYQGKSKDVLEITAGKYAGKYKFVFKDDATGYYDEKGKPVFDPGCDVVVGKIPGKGAVACKFTSHFFELLKREKIPSHYIDTINGNEIIVEPALPLGISARAPEFKGSAGLLNLEFTFRNNATGSLWRRYPFAKPGEYLGTVVEAWTKGDEDILITYEVLEALKIMDRDEINYVDRLVKNIAGVVEKEFASKGLHVIDGKFELGRLKSNNGKVAIIDEISPDVLRVCRGYLPDNKGDCTAYKECITTKLVDGKRKISGKNQMKASELEKIFGM